MHRWAHVGVGQGIAVGILQGVAAAVQPLVALVVLAADPVDQGVAVGVGRYADGRARHIAGAEVDQAGAGTRRARLDVTSGHRHVSQQIALGTLFHDVAVRTVGDFLADAVAGRTETPVLVGVAARGGPEAACAGSNEAGFGVDGVGIVGVLQDQLLVSVQAQLVLLEVAVPARQGILVGAEHADEHLVQVGALRVDAHGQAHRGEHAVDGLDLAEDVVERVAQCRAQVGLCGQVVILAFALAGHALEQRGPAGPLAAGCRGGLDGVDLHAEAGVQELGPFIRHVVLRSAGAQGDGGRRAAGSPQRIGCRLGVAGVVLRSAVADVDDVGAGAVGRVRAVVGRTVECAQALPGNA